MGYNPAHLRVPIGTLRGSLHCAILHEPVALVPQ